MMDKDVHTKFVKNDDYIEVSIKTKGKDGAEFLTTIMSKSNIEHADLMKHLTQVRQFFERDSKCEVCSLKETFDSSDDLLNGRLLFHHHCGKNLEIEGDGITARLVGSDCRYAGVITKRPLHQQELFEVKIDVKSRKAAWWGSKIGVTTHSPGTFEFNDTFLFLQSGIWLFGEGHVWINGPTEKKLYGMNIDKLEVGDRIAAQVDKNKELHFYVNGKDLGMAAERMPDILYGVFEMGTIKCVTIIRGRAHSLLDINSVSVAE